MWCDWCLICGRACLRPLTQRSRCWPRSRGREMMFVVPRVIGAVRSVSVRSAWRAGHVSESGTGGVCTTLLRGVVLGTALTACMSSTTLGATM